MPITETVQPPANSFVMPAININQHDERQWKQTLLQVSEVICLQMPESSVGYRLRRYAIWHSITMLPKPIVKVKPLSAGFDGSHNGLQSPTFSTIKLPIK